MGFNHAFSGAANPNLLWWTIARIARFAFLAPEITTAILEGSQPASLFVRKLMRTSDLPMDWKQQKLMLGFG